MNNAPRSDALVFFGATGDLAYKKIFPALHAMARRGHLEFPVIGVAKSGWNLDQLRARARESIEKHGGGVNDEAFKRLIAHLRYIDGDYQDPATYTALRKAMDGAKYPAHYLAIPPSLFATVIENLGKSGCARNGRVIVEKPFGHDLASAQALNETLHTVFDESASLSHRPLPGQGAGAEPGPVPLRQFLSRADLESALCRERADHDGRELWGGGPRSLLRRERRDPRRGAEPSAPGRGVPGDGAAADHLSRVDPGREGQSLPFDLAAGPGQLGARTIQRLSQGAGRGPDSTVETFAAVRLHIDSWRWEGVPFFIRAGKCMPVTATEVWVTLKRPPLRKLRPQDANYYRFRLGPDVIIAVGAQIKKPGEHMDSEPTELKVVQRPEGEEMDAYERLLGDAMAGDHLLFTRQDAVEAQWAIVQPILGDVTPVLEYQPGTWGPAKADQLAAEVDGWHNPPA